MARKIFISAGHSNNPSRDRGAIFNNIIEGDLTVDLRNLIIKELEKKTNANFAIIKDSDDTVTKDTIAIISKSLNQNDIAIDIHFNAANAISANGSEVVIPSNHTEFEHKVASCLLLLICDSLGTKQRRVITEEETARGKLALMQANCETILIEVCFITNAEDMIKYHSNKQILVRNLANYLVTLV